MQQLFRETAQRRLLRPWERRARKFFGSPATFTFLEAYRAGEDAVFSGAMPKSPHSASEDEKGGRLLSRIKAVLDEAEDDATAMKRLRGMMAELEAEDEDEEESEGRVSGRDDEPERVDVGWRGISTPMHSERVGRADEAQREFHKSYTKKLRESGTGMAGQGVPRGGF